jgi:ABC-type transport system involved in multi-copper enzyme maturation permease subunit
VNRELIVAFWRQRVSSAFRMAFLLLLFGFPLLMTAAMPLGGLGIVRDAVGITMVLAAGMIGQDVSSGVLQLLFARPVRRSEYVLSRWLAVAFAAGVVAVLQIALAWLIVTARGAPLESSTVLLTMLQRVIEVIQITAVMAMLSSLANGVSDLALWFAATVLGGILQLAAQMKGWGWIGRVGAEINRIVGPDVGLVALARGTGGWSDLVTTLSIAALALLIAVVLVNRKELSYATTG